MGFISNAVKLMHGKKSTEDQDRNGSVVENSTDFDFSLRNYAKESFTVLIQKPFSACMLKFMRGMTFTVVGVMSGTLLACIVCIIFMQFGSVENSVISGLISNKFEKIFPDAELSIRSANFYWNSETNSFEIGMKKVRINDFLVPYISIQPDYVASLKEHTLVAKNISITSPRIRLDVSDDWKNTSIDPNLGNRNSKKSIFVPINTIDDFKQIIKADTNVKIVNADVSLLRNKDKVDLKNVYCEYAMNSIFPTALAGTVILPGQKYSSSFSINRISDNACKVKLVSMNPDALIKTFEKLAIPVDQRITAMIEGYNLPVSGNINLNFDNEKLQSGNFELTGVNGSVRLPSNNSFALNLGKKIDHGDIYGSFNSQGAQIDSLRVAYGNSGLQLTGMKIPFSNFRFLNTVNIDGTLSLTNIDVSEMESLLPQKVSTSAVSPLKACLPEFNLETFKVDLKGPITFNSDSGADTLKIGQGIFTVKDAQIPLGSQYINHVNASGIVMNDGIDIKIANAQFNGVKINQGVLYISSKDGALIGNANIDLPIKTLSQYSKFISPKLAQLPLDKLDIKGVANLDVKIVSLNSEQNNGLPFKVVQGNGFISSDMNAKRLQISWDSKRATMSGDVSTGNTRVSLQFNEDFKKNTGHSLLKFRSESPFLRAMLPSLTNALKGDYILTLNTNWKDEVEDSVLSANLKGATLYTPFTGTMKSKDSDGKLTAHIVKRNGIYDCSNIKFTSEKNKIKGSMSLGKNGEIIRCNFPVFSVNDTVARIQMLQKEDNQKFMSLVGDSADCNQILSFCKGRSIYTVASMYLNLHKVKYGTEILKNVQGTVEVQNNRIIGGACYGILGKDTTVALSVKNIDGNAITTLSASNAGDFLKYFKISEGVHGGNLNIVIKGEKGIGEAQAGIFEITDSTVNCDMLNKLISLSSVNLLPTDNLTVGFNRCAGKFVFTNKEIIVDKCVAVGPSFTIGFSGRYDRKDDALHVTGGCVPMSSYYTSNTEGALSSPFNITGSLGNPQIQVLPMEEISLSAAQELTGNSLPRLARQATDGDVSSVSSSNDIFEQGAFDKKVEKKATREVIPVQHKKGVTVVRGKN